MPTHPTNIFCKAPQMFLQPSFRTPSPGTQLQGTPKVSQAQFLVNHVSFKERNCITVKAATSTPQRALSVNHLFSSKDVHIPNNSNLTQWVFSHNSCTASCLTVDSSFSPFCSIGYTHLHNCCEIM